MNAILESSLGAALKVLVAESAGALLGSSTGANIDADLNQWSWRSLAPLAVCSGMLVAYKTESVRKGFWSGVAALGLICSGQPAVSPTGMVLGGYAGRLIAGAPTALWDARDPGRCYLISMLRYMGTGLLFDLVIRSPERPAFVVTCLVPRQLIKLTLQSIAYSAPDLIPMLMRRFAVRKFDRRIVVPLLCQLMQKYFTADQIAESALITVTPESSSLTRLSLFLFSTPLALGGSFLLQRYTYPTKLMEAMKTRVITAMSPHLANLLHLQAVTDRLVNSPSFLLGSLLAYLKTIAKVSSIDLQREPQENVRLLEGRLRDLIEKPDLPFLTFFQPGADRLFQNWTDSFIDWKNGEELSLIGLPLSSEMDPHLKAILPIHCKHFAYFMVRYRESFQTDLTLAEEEDLLYEVTGAILSLARLSIEKNSFCCASDLFLRGLARSLYSFLNSLLHVHYNVALPLSDGPERLLREADELVYEMPTLDEILASSSAAALQQAPEIPPPSSQAAASQSHPLPPRSYTPVELRSFRPEQASSEEDENTPAATIPLQLDTTRYRSARRFSLRQVKQVTRKALSSINPYSN